MDRLKPDEKEGKILCDLEQIHNLECLIKKPTRVTKTSQTLLDVMMTNKPELFRTANVYEPGISDHAMVYGIMRERELFIIKVELSLLEVTKVLMKLCCCKA